MSLWKKYWFQIAQYFSPTTHMYIKKISKETSFYTCGKKLRASLTLEAAVVIPLMVGFLLTIVSFFHLIRVQMLVEESLIYTGRKVAVESCVVKEEVLQIALAQAHLLAQLKEEPLIEQYVEGGCAGVLLIGSSFEGDVITLHATYSVKLPLSFLWKERFIFWSQNKFRKWVGDGSIQEENGDWVYITPNGEVYHESKDCRVLSFSIHASPIGAISAIRGSNGQKYTPCPLCQKKSADARIVYYTDYGERYHLDINCSYIDRTIIRKERSQIEGRRPCAFCCGGEE